VKFERARPDDVDWERLDAFEDRTFSQRRGWLEFVRETQGAELVLARLLDGGATVGWFTGLVVRRFGVPILGSPFPGWGTPSLGFNLDPGVPRGEAARALLPFAFRGLGCLHLELADPLLARSDAEALGFEVRTARTFISDLTPDEDEIFAGMESSTRRNWRKSVKSGVTVEEAAPEGFAAEYYTHLLDVFAKQQMRPTYDRERVERMLRHVHPTGDLLLLRARDSEGRSIATGIYPGYNRGSYFWGNGSLREHQILRPNEALHWHAMRTWKERGATAHDWGGGGDYKAKYGGTETQTRFYRVSRYRAIGRARDLARAAYYLPRRVQRRRHLRRIDGGR
jgi:hypothetical protein